MTASPGVRLVAKFKTLSQPDILATLLPNRHGDQASPIIELRED